MALQKEFKSIFGVNFPEAYHRIAAVNVNRGIHCDENVVVAIDTWVSAKARQDLMPAIYSKNIVLPPLENKTAADSVVGEVYNQIKVMDEFVGSVDV